MFLTTLDAYYNFSYPKARTFTIHVVFLSFSLVERKGENEYFEYGKVPVTIKSREFHFSKLHGGIYYGCVQGFPCYIGAL